MSQESPHWKRCLYLPSPNSFPIGVTRRTCLAGYKEVEIDKMGKNRLGPICGGILYIAVSGNVTQREA